MSDESVETVNTVNPNGGKQWMSNGNIPSAYNTPVRDTEPFYPVSTNPHHTVSGDELVPTAMDEILSAEIVDEYAPHNQVLEPRRSARKTEPIDYDDMLKKGMTAYRDRRLLNVRSLSLLKDRAINICNMNFKKGVATFGDLAREAIRKELQQVVVDYEVCKPVHKKYCDVAYMRTHDLMTEKLDGTLKARYVVGKVASWNGVDDIDWGIDTYSPTIDMKLLNLMISISIHEHLAIDVWDIKGAFLQAKLVTEGVYAKIEPHIAAYMVEIKPD